MDLQKGGTTTTRGMVVQRTNRMVGLGLGTSSVGFRVCTALGWRGWFFEVKGGVRTMAP